MAHNQCPHCGESIDRRVIAIRADARIGNGTCSMVSECWSDAELIKELDLAGITQARKAVSHFRAYERLIFEHAEEIRNA